MIYYDTLETKRQFSKLGEIQTDAYFLKVSDVCVLELRGSNSNKFYGKRDYDKW